VGGAIFPITSATGGTEAIEGGLRIVNGQLKVGSNMGPKDAPLQAHLTARYWGGADKGWMVSDFDSATSVPTGQGTYSVCIGVTCPLLPLTAPSVVLAAGKGTFTVPPPGVRGRAQLQFDTLKYLVPVPGTLTFGIRKSPVIYIREAY
jgi:MSHA biogenesis protein MshQ